MAANGWHIPDVKGTIVQGYTVGDMALSCVKGYITAITFVLPDVTVSTTTRHDGSGDSNLGFDNALGYVSEPNGNPCFSGMFYTNAPHYLATLMTLRALSTGGQAYATSQQTLIGNALGGTTASLTGFVGKAMLGTALDSGTQHVMHWFMAREKNAFDAVYVPAGKKAVINITTQIDINYPAKGRKLYYAHTTRDRHPTTLD